MTDIIEFHDPAVLSEPFPLYAELRATAPVAKAIGPNGRAMFLVTSYALIEEVTKRTEDFSSQFGHLLIPQDGIDPELAAILAQDWMRSGLLLSTDDPEHKRYRALVNAVFSQAKIAKMTATIERIADDLIDQFIEAGECDFVNQFAVLLPTYIIADILGLPRHEYPQVRQWSDAVIRIVSRMGSRAEEIAAAHDVVKFRRFILSTIRGRRESAADDLISDLVHVRVDDLPPLTDDEIGPLAFEIAVAGNETTRNTLMSGLVRLLGHPEQMQALMDDPSLVANAVEELLRYETPATSMWRIAARDTELGGCRIPAGAELLLRFDAGNRDPGPFEEPDRFDIRRKNAVRHMAFGAPGIHRCLGQMLARKELSIAFPKLLRRLRNIRIVAEASNTAYWPGLLHRGITSLRIAFEPGPRVL